jgi:mannosyltransferase OCH1-like enzyme
MHPKVIYFCNRIITEKDRESSNNWKKLNPEYEIKLYDDEMIRSFLLEEYGELHKDIFDYLQAGPIKADFWRICILYKKGGIYSDIDIMPLVKLSDFIEKNVDFVTCSSYWRFNYNPNFIVSDKDNIILKKCIDWYVNKYIKKNVYDYWDWSIMNSLTQNLHLENYRKNWGVYSFDNMKIQILKENHGRNHYDAHVMYNNVRVFNNRQPAWNYYLHKFN